MAGCERSSDDHPTWRSRARLTMPTPAALGDEERVLPPLPTRRVAPDAWLARAFAGTVSGQGVVPSCLESQPPSQRAAGVI